MRSVRWAAVVAGLALGAPGVSETVPAATTKPAPSRKSAPKANKISKTEAPRQEDARPKYKYALGLSLAVRNQLADKKRDEAIEQLKTLLPRFDDQSPEKPDLLFQLSELYWEKYKYLYANEEERHEAAYADYEARKAKGENLPPPKVDHSGSDQYRVNAVGIYEEILKSFPKYERNDEVLFSLAYNLHDLGHGRQREAVQRYEELIKKYPKSKFVPDAYVQLGDHWFEVNNLDNAQKNFEKAFESDSPKIHSYALYKLAWCDFNRGDYEGALKKLHQVVDFAEDHGKEMVDLKNEALNDCVVVYTQLDRSEAAIAYFGKKTNKQRQAKLIGKLADALADAGHYDSAIKTYRFLIQQDPMRPEAPTYQQSIVRGYEKLLQRDRVKQEVQRLAELYRPGGVWWKANEADAATLRDAFDVAEDAMRSVVTDYHREAQLTQKVDTYRLARDIYKQYVDAFASSKDPNLVSDYAFNMRFYYAEILWTLEQWEDAAEQYDQVVAFKIPARETAKEISNEAYRKNAAYNAILAYNKLLKIDKGELEQSHLKDDQKVSENKTKGGVEKNGQIFKRDAKDLQEKPLSHWEDRLAAACDAYTNLYPGEKDEIDIRYQAAVIFYDKNHFTEAAKRFAQIILKWPEEKRSQQAADLTLYILDARQQWLELSQISEQFLANKRLTRPGTDFARRVASIVEGSRYKWIDEVVYKQEKNPEKAADEFVKFVKDFPRSKMADRAITYAMLTYREAKQLDRAIDAGERFLKDHSGSPLEPKVRFILAQLDEKVADFGRAAAQYDQFIASYDRQVKQLEDAKKKLHEARARSQGNKPGAQSTSAADTTASEEAATDDADPLKRRADAIADWQKLLDEAKPWLPDAQFNAALWYEGMGQVDKAVAGYKQYISRFHDRKDVPDIAFNIGMVYEKAGRWQEAARAFQHFDEQYAHDPRTGASRHFLAKDRWANAAHELKWKDSERLESELLHGYSHLPGDAKKDPAVVAAYSRARFLAIDPTWKQYTDIKLNHLTTIKRDLTTKRKKLVELEKSYIEVLQLGVGRWGIAALTRIGMAYGDLAKDILDSPNPKGLDPDQLDMYRSELQNLASPLEEKAQEALEKALAKAYELSIYDEWTLTAQNLLNNYKPGTYPAVREVPFQGSEFFATAPLYLGDKAELASEKAPAEPAAPAAEPNQKAPPPATDSGKTIGSAAANDPTASAPVEAR